MIRRPRSSRNQWPRDAFRHQTEVNSRSNQLFRNNYYSFISKHREVQNMLSVTFCEFTCSWGNVVYKHFWNKLLMLDSKISFINSRKKIQPQIAPVQNLWGSLYTCSYSFIPGSKDPPRTIRPVPWTHPWLIWEFTVKNAKYMAFKYITAVVLFNWSVHKRPKCPKVKY